VAGDQRIDRTAAGDRFDDLCRHIGRPDGHSDGKYSQAKSPLHGIAPGLSGYPTEDARIHAAAGGSVSRLAGRRDNHVPTERAGYVGTPGPAPQYLPIPGITFRTPPVGSATSPARLGITWMWACMTVWPATVPSLKPTL
jgi:hypothetical protein